MRPVTSKTVLLIGVPCLACVLCAAPVQADLLVATFEGTFVGYSGALRHDIEAALGLPASFSGEILFDSDAADTASQSNIGSFDAIISSSLTISGGTVAGAFDGSMQTFDLATSDSLFFNGGSTTFGGFTFDQVQLVMRGTLSGTSLTQFDGGADLSDFSGFNSLTLSASGSLAQGELSAFNITPVPAPGAVSLGLLGLSTLVALRRRAV